MNPFEQPWDLLSRLISAVTTGPEWGQSYAYDGFGNRTSVTVTKGTAPAGNLSYDIDNRLACAGSECYSYDADNRRVWKSTGNQLYFYGVDGRRMGTYQVSVGGQYWLNIQPAEVNLHFAGRLIRSQDKWVATDRLGSVVKRETERLRYFPWGEEQVTSTQNRDKFATYFRDSTGLDYAMNRYYSSQHGRFLTPDPYISSGGLGSPQSWNRYADVENDPVNFYDPYGLQVVEVGAPPPPDPTPSGGTRGSGDPGGSDGMEVVADLLDGGGGSAGGGLDPALLLANATTAALNAFQDPACAGLFNTNSSRPQTYGPGLVLQAMMLDVPLSGTYFGKVAVASLPQGYKAWTEPGQDKVSTGSEARASTANIVLQNGPNGPRYTEASPQELASTLIHELGHVFNIVMSLGGSAIQQDVNPDGTPNPEAQTQNEKSLSNCRPRVP